MSAKDGPNGRTVVNTKPVDMELVYAALITFAEDEEAVKFLDENGYDISLSKMAVFRRGCTELTTSPYFKPYQERREKLAPILQQKLENDLLGISTSTSTAVQFAVDQAQGQLENGECKDPARTARDLMQVATQSIDKRQLLKGQPTAITEHRNLDEIAKKLEAIGAAKRVDAESTAEDETANEIAETTDNE